MVWMQFISNWLTHNSVVSRYLNSTCLFEAQQELHDFECMHNLTKTNQKKKNLLAKLGPDNACLSL